MKKLYLFLIILAFNFNSIKAQEIFYGFGSEMDFFRAEYKGTVNSNYYYDNYSYNLNVDELCTNVSWLNVKLGYLTSNKIYLGLQGSLIFPIMEDGEVLKEELWTKFKTNDNPYFDESKSQEAVASYKYYRFFAIDLGYDISPLVSKEKELNLICGLGIYFHDRYLGEVVKTYNSLDIGSYSESDFLFTDNGRYKEYSDIAFSAKFLMVYKYFYAEVSIGQVNSIGLGVMFKKKLKKKKKI